MQDAIIIGGGPAGLSAALVLARCRRTVLIVDSGQPRNGASRALHGYLTRDGVSPLDLRRLGREELEKYPGVEFQETTVTDARRMEGGFELTLLDGRSVAAQLLLLATGRVDPVPEIPGFREYYGRGVFHCPYCDGWEHRDEALAVLGSGPKAVDLALVLLTWSAHVTIIADIAPAWSEEAAATLREKQIRVVTGRVTRAQGSDRLQRLFFQDREPLACQAVFFISECTQRSTLPERLGCSFDDEFSVRCDGNAATGVPGLYVAGNVRGGLHFAIAAAAEGVEAALAMNEALLERALPVAAERSGVRG
ncbi:MAG: hypothetical protein RIQ93_2407 [Verrucomicrobiota bacterium]|jgi:thioredoxin reductase